MNQQQWSQLSNDVVHSRPAAAMLPPRRSSVEETLLLNPDDDQTTFNPSLCPLNSLDSSHVLCLYCHAGDGKTCSGATQSFAETSFQLNVEFSLVTVCSGMLCQTAFIDKSINVLNDFVFSKTKSRKISTVDFYAFFFWVQQVAWFSEISSRTLFT